jgi:hypothetical protein
VHSLLPLAAAYVPAKQLAQSVASSWYAALVPASERYFPDAQLVQVPEATQAVYAPAPQTRQSFNESCSA